MANFWTSSQCAFMSTLSSSRMNASDEEALGAASIAALHAHFIELLQTVGKSLKCRQRVVATSYVYFKRLYLVRGFQEVDPLLAVAATLWLATKTEEFSQPVALVLEKLVECTRRSSSSSHATERTRAQRIRPQDVVECELVVLAALDFELVVHHPYRDLVKYVHDLDLERGESEVMQTAWSVVNDSFYTQLCLHVPPFAIALAALFIACTHAGYDCAEWLAAQNVRDSEFKWLVAQLVELYAERAAAEERAGGKGGGGAQRLDASLFDALHARVPERSSDDDRTTTPL